MDYRRAASPPSTSIPSRSHAYSHYRSPNRTPHHSPHASRSYAGGAAPMSIPNSSRASSPPPPLPPPTFLSDIAEGRDLAWDHLNTPWKAELQHRPTSPHLERGSRRNNSGYDEGYFEPSESRRRNDSTTMVTSLPGVEGFDRPPHGDEGYGSLSGSSLAQLQGERSLDRKNRKDSSHAYDNRMLSMIGRPRTPTRASTAGSLESSPGSVSQKMASKPSRSNKHPQLKSLSISNRSLSISSDSPLKVGSPYSSRWANSPQSSAVSPGLMSEAASAKSYMDSRLSPIFDNDSIASSSTSAGLAAAETAMGSSVEQQRFNRVQAKTQRSDSNLSLAMMAASINSPPSARPAKQRGGVVGDIASRGGLVGAEIISGMSSRGSHDHRNFFANDPETGLGQSDSDLPMKETGSGMRHLNLDDPSPIQHHPSTASTFSSQRPFLSPSHQGMQGVKRRASSPPREASHDDRPPPQQAQAQAQQQQQQPPGVELRRTPGQHHLLANSASRSHHPPHSNRTSYSSTSSAGLPNGSYASSTGFSVGANPITSAPSQDRLSPGVIPNTSEQHEAQASPYINTLSLDPGLRALDSQVHSQIGTEAQLTAAAAQKVSAENANRLNQQGNTPKMQANIHICDCCSKKPKKFDTLEELRQHQAEKQYFCQYCHNRFKNKNEAERHQNSLHLRRHSWSCATLERRFGAAFYPCTAVPPHTNAGNIPPPQQGGFAAVDVCGYCGDEFPNTPEPDWVSRSEHLTKVHKFGECNQSKKFYRADHFRQHLKHSHGGTSGKWTNMLEAACMKDEPPATQEAIAMSSAQQAAQAVQQAQAAQAAAAAQNQAQQQQQQHQQQSQQQQPPLALSSYQAAQLQGASAPVANMMGAGTQLRQGPYPAMPPMPSNGNIDLQFQKIEEADVKDDHI